MYKGQYRATPLFSHSYSMPSVCQSFCQIHLHSPSVLYRRPDAWRPLSCFLGTSAATLPKPTFCAMWKTSRRRSGETKRNSSTTISTSSVTIGQKKYSYCILSIYLFLYCCFCQIYAKKVFGNGGDIFFSQTACVNQAF